jgi:hypothetical protein
MRKMLKGVYMKFLARSAAAGAIACGLVLGSAALPSALHTTSVSYAAQTKKSEDSAAVKAVKRAIKAELERVARHNANLNGTTVQWGDTLIDGNLDKVKELSLSYVTLDDAAKTLLGQLNNLNALKLTNCKLTDPELSSIVSGKQLTYLDVSGNKLEKLSGLPDSLKSLVANNNEITDISGISSLSNLGLLQLRGNKLADTTENVNALTIRAKSINLCEVELSGKLADNYAVKEALITVYKNNKEKQLQIDELKKQLADEISSIDSSHSLLEGYLRLQNAHPNVRYAILYRLYNNTTGEHLFTPKEAEKNNLVALGWKLEGAAGLIPATEGDEVYRLYNPWTGEHHYTTDTNEVKNLVKIGWKDEGVCFYSSRSAKRTPVYSLYNPNRTEFYHHYTAKLDEIEKNVRDGWKKEGAKWYVEEV